MQNGIIQTNGAKIFYSTTGQGSPIIILHGGPGFDHIHMLPFAEFADTYRIIFYDQRATGRSSSNVDADSITVNNFVNDLETLRIELNLNMPHLIGHSWGACLALHYAIKYPENISSMILLGTGGAGSKYFSGYLKNMQNQTPEHDRKALRKIATSAAYKNKDIETLSKYYRIAVKSLFHDKSLIKKLDLTLTKNTANNQADIARLLLNDLGEFDIHSELSRITCPTLIIQGEKDIFPPQAAYDVFKSLADSRLIFLENTGHFVFIEAPTKTFSTIRQFLANPASIPNSIPANLITEKTAD